MVSTLIVDPQARRRPAVVALALCAAITCWAGPAVAATVDVLVDSDSITLEEGEAGESSGKVVVINTRDERVDLEPTVEGDAGCSVKPDPLAVEPGRRTPVTLTFGAGCEVTDGADVELGFGSGVTPPSVTLKAVADDESAPDWWVLGVAAAAALAMAFAVLLVVLLGIRKHNEAAAQQQAVHARLAQRQHDRARQEEARAAVGSVDGIEFTALGDEPSVQDDDPPKVGWKTPLAGLGTDWSFKDSWVSNVTIGATALVLLLAASDVLKGVLGQEPEAALTVMTVAGALAAVLVGLGPLLLKAVGESTGIATVGGTISAGLVVLLGSLLQVTAVTVQAALLTDEVPLQVLAALLGIVTAAIVVVYAARSLTQLVKKGTETPAAVVTPEERAAWIIAKALQPDLVRTQLSPLEIEEALADDPGVEAAWLSRVVEPEWAAPTGRRRTALI